MTDLSDVEIDDLEDANNMPLARRLWSRTRMREVLLETTVYAAHPAYVWRCLVRIVPRFLEALFDLFLAIIGSVFILPCYVFFVVRLTTFPLWVPIMLRYYRGKKYRQSLEERKRRTDLHKLRQQKEVWK